MILKTGYILFLGFLSVFIVWRRLKEDYVGYQIFGLCVFLQIPGIIMYLLSKRFYPDFSFWAAVTGLVLGFVIAVYRYRFKIYETAETIILAVLPFLSGIYFLDAMANKSVFSLAASVITAGIIVLFKLLNDRYKYFGWYKSGKVGFAGFTAGGLYFLLRGAVAIIFPFMLSFSGHLEPIISGTVAFLLFLGVFNLARIS